MSELLERVIRRQTWIRESRDVALVCFFLTLPVAFFALVGIRESILVAGTAFTLGGIAYGVICVLAVWVAIHLLREARRLQKLLSDPDLINRLQQETGLDGRVRWSGLIPFANRQGKEGDES